MKYVQSARAPEKMCVRQASGCTPPSRKTRSRPKVVGFDSNLHHVPNMSPIKLTLPKIGGHRSPTVAFTMGCSRKLVFQFGVNGVDLLLRQSLIPLFADPVSVSNPRLLDLGLTDWDVPFQSRFLSLELMLFLLLSEFLPSQSEAFHRLAVGPSHQNLATSRS